MKATDLLDSIIANAEKRTYVLTDGIEEYETRSMYDWEFRDAQHKAVEATDGNVWWYDPSIS